MKKSLLIICFLLFISCASNHTVVATEDPSGFFGGLIHGIIVVPAFLLSLFFDGIAVYNVNNTGGWYDFGFLIGVGALFFGSTRYKRSGRRRYYH